MRNIAVGLLLGAFASLALPTTHACAETPLELLLKQAAKTEAVAAPAAAQKRPAGTHRVSRTVTGGAGGQVAALISREAARQGLPAGFAIAIARTESGLRCQAVGRHGELGPFQIKPATARGIGYTGPASALNSCGAGITWGIRHLMIGYRKCGSTTGAAALHNGGLGASCRATGYTRRVASRY
jgi:soluble lytic murein transglycosylase-like protein